MKKKYGGASIRKLLMTSNSELRINPNSSIAQIAETT